MPMYGTIHSSEHNCKINPKLNSCLFNVTKQTSKMQFSFSAVIAVLGLAAQTHAYACYSSQATCETQCTGCAYDSTGVNGLHYCADCY